MAVLAQTPPRLASSSRQAAFTLIELLVVILIIGILIAIAVPTFLNQQQKAQNSAAQQTLAVAYKDAKANMATNGGTFPDYQTLAAQIASAEPEYTVGTAIFSSDQAVTAGPYGKLWVLLGSTGSNGTLASTNGQNLYLADVSNSGAVCTLTVTNDGPPVYGNCGGTSSGSAGAAVVAPATSGQPVISGAIAQGQTLSVTLSSYSGSPTYSYQWQDCNSAGASCSNISSASGGTGATYTLAASDAGSTMRVIVTATNAGGSTSNTSAATSVVPAYANANVVASYNLTTASGLTDSSGNGNTGSYYTGSSGITLNAPDENSTAGAATFSGSAGNLIDLGDPSDLQLTHGTYAAWIQTSTPSSTTSAGIIGQRFAQVIQIYNGQAVAYDSGGSGLLNSGVAVNNSHFHQVVLTFTASQECLYVDGGNQVCGSLTQQSLASDVVIGAGDKSVGFQPFNGTIAHPLILNTVLSATQVKALYNQG
jgi:prepilin-type N-terminal cleavage/methylation domain-containing protein